MTSARQRTAAGTAKVSGRAGGNRKAGGDRGRAAAGQHVVLALQRSAGNAAVNALMAAKLRSPGGQAVTDIDAALPRCAGTSRRSTRSRKG